MLERWNDQDGAMCVRLRLTEAEQREMCVEQIAMMSDAGWLLEHALRGTATTGPLTLPLTRIPIREEES